MLDLTQAAKSFDDVCGWVTRAIARNLTDERGLLQAMTLRPRLRWRADLDELILRRTKAGTIRCWSSAITGTWSGRMACPSRVGRCRLPSRTDAEDSGNSLCTTDYGVVVELDGRLAHPAENQWKDKARDNAAAAEGQQSLRYDWIK